MIESLALVILDGWGLAPPGPGNAISLAETPVFDRLWARFPHTAALRPGPRRRPARRADGQLGGRPPQPRRRRDRQAGPGADRRRDRRRQLLRERGAAGGLRPRPPQPARAPAPARPRLRRRRPLRLGAHRGDDRAGLAGGRPRRRLPRLHRRPRHAAPRRSRLPRRAGALAAPGRPRRHRRRALLRDGPRHALGADQARLRRDRPRPRAARGERRGGDRGLLRARGDRRVRQADGDRRLRRRRRGRRGDLRQLPPRPGPRR